MLDEVSNDDLSKRYVERLTALTELTSVLEYIVKNVLRIQNEITAMEEELVARGFIIKEIEDASQIE